MAYGDLYVRTSSSYAAPNKNTTRWVVILFGGPEEIRTPDPYNANVMRSQLRYRPKNYLISILLRRREVKKNFPGGNTSRFISFHFGKNVL